MYIFCEIDKQFSPIMASKNEIWIHIEDILQCPICVELLQDARSLPCGHTFCQRCIEQCQVSVDGISCPMCREHFIVSSIDWFSELPRNFIAEDISDIVITLKENGTLGNGSDNTFDSRRTSRDHNKSKENCELSYLIRLL